MIRRIRSGAHGLGADQDLGDDSGYALVATMWMLGLVALMATAFNVSARLYFQSVANGISTARAEASADGVMALAIRDLVEAPSHPNRPRRFAVGGGGTVCSVDDGLRSRVVIQDEAGKVDLNTADEPLITALLIGLGLAPASAQRLAAAILDARDRDNDKRPGGAEAADYAAAGRTGPRNASFDVVDDVDQVLGMPGWLLARLQTYVTVTSRQAGLAAEAITPDLRAILDTGYRQLGLTVDSALLPSGAATLAMGKAFTITVVTEGEGARFVRSSKIELVRSRSRSYRLVDWRRGALPLVVGGTGDAARC